MTSQKPFNAVAYATEKLGTPTVSTDSVGGLIWYAQGVALSIYIDDGVDKMNYWNQATGGEGIGCAHPEFIRNAIDDAAANWVPAPDNDITIGELREWGAGARVAPCGGHWIWIDASAASADIDIRLVAAGFRYSGINADGRHEWWREKQEGVR